MLVPNDHAAIRAPRAALGELTTENTVRPRPASAHDSSLTLIVATNHVHEPPPRTSRQVHTLLMARTQEVVEANGSVVRRKPLVGDMRWDGKAWQRWSGRRWAHAPYSLHPARLKVATPFDRLSAIDDASRDRALALAVEKEVTANSASVVFDGPNGVVLAYRPRVAHLFHAFMSLITGGFWAVI